MPLPWIIGGAIAAGVAYMATRDDDDDYDYDDSYERKKAERAARKEANDAVLKEIEDYKGRQVEYFLSAYNVNISFTTDENSVGLPILGAVSTFGTGSSFFQDLSDIFGGSANVPKTFNIVIEDKNRELKESLKTMEKEISELETLIQDMREERDAVLG